MYFINEKAMAMSRDGKSVSFENGLPTLYQVQKTNPNRKIVIWNVVSSPWVFDTERR